MMTSKYMSIGLSLCLGLSISAVGQAAEPGQNDPPLLPQAEAPLPPELTKGLEETVPPPLLPELQGLEQKDIPPPPPELKGLEDTVPPPLPPELQKMMEQVPEVPEQLPVLPPPLSQEKESLSAPEKTAAAQTKASMPTNDIALFSHKFHVEKAGFNCTDCHDSIFQQTAGSAKAKGDFNMASFGQGKYCGTCHDGSTAFAVTDQDSCIRCHGTDMKPPAKK